MPERAPPSIVMLQIVMRSSIENLLTKEPVYSITCPVPPPVPILAINARMMSLADTPALRLPSILTSIVFGFFWRIHWLANTCPTSLVPIPKDRAPNAPCVEVWLSPQTIVIPGWVKPLSGATT